MGNHRYSSVSDISKNGTMIWYKRFYFLTEGLITNALWFHGWDVSMEQIAVPVQVTPASPKDALWRLAEVQPHYLGLARVHDLPGAGAASQGKALH